MGKRKWRPFEEAQEYAHSLSLKNRAGWVAHCKSGQRPDDLPAYPNEVYEGQWASWGDWLGTDNRKGGWRPFEEAREFVRTLGLKSQREWLEYCRSGQKPDDIPSDPKEVYKNAGWAGMGCWLGTGNVKAGSVKYRPFAEAREYARSLGIRASVIAVGPVLGSHGARRSCAHPSPSRPPAPFFPSPRSKHLAATSLGFAQQPLELGKRFFFYGIEIG
jgi:hypothetical protein